MRRGVGIAMLWLTGLAACATPVGKPVLSRSAFHRMARTCGVTPTDYRRGHGHLPHVAFLYRDAAGQTDVRAAPSVACMDASLKAYRYAYFSPMADPPEPDLPPP
ncbi:hypothetical protein ACQKJZ_05205 [Sphingomonas sp. NPDC019816]|uniref:hypothetical protein n=1 Tax=Sphingomonas sp. NPDC019816 TaxID=3390679 RepID=UPI003CFF4B4C